jgi:hypothetical protein
MKILLCCLLLLFSLNIKAQHPFGPSGEGNLNHASYLGIHGGAILPFMSFNNTPFDQVVIGRMIRQNSGLSFRYEKISLFSIGVLLTYREQGVQIKDLNQLALKANYLNVFVPIEKEIKLSRLRKTAGPSVILFAGPYAAYFLYGNAKDKQHEMKLTTQTINLWDAGAEAGLGFRIPTFSMEKRSNLNLKVSYYYGLINSLPATLPDVTDEQFNTLLLSETGTRFNQGIRLTLSYEIALGKHNIQTFTAGGDGKNTYKKFIVF